jgi:RNA polymerase sigma factor (TIGR02999 family)
MAENEQIEATIAASTQGDPRARDRIVELLYPQLRSMAANQMRSERSNHTLQPTALVSAAYERLCGQRQLDWNNRAHVLGLAATMMRRVLLDHAKKKKRRPQTVQEATQPLAEVLSFEGDDPHDFLALDAALTELEVLHPRPAKVVELRYIGGLTEDETAAVLGVSSDTVKRDWRFARSWLNCRLGGAPSKP